MEERKIKRMKILDRQQNEKENKKNEKLDRGKKERKKKNDQTAETNRKKKIRLTVWQKERRKIFNRWEKETGDQMTERKKRLSR